MRLPGSLGGGRKREGARGQGGEMAQTMYAYVNKWIKKKILIEKKKRHETQK
jgi:hypothetical protein